MYRTHTCGQLRSSDAGTNVTLAGWVHSTRSHGKLVFIDIRDRYGITQATIHEDMLPGPLHKESVIQITGQVKTKPEPNKALVTGEIEIQVAELNILTDAKPLPMDENATDDIRLQYRYLDIRQGKVLNNLDFRYKFIHALRNFSAQAGFMEVETPLLVKSTPEGARDYVVPSRVNAGKFYALPQSPQLYKQICMIAGVDKYFQLARCMRDEDLRADRQPEHTQYDFEMSFVHAQDVRKFVEELLTHAITATTNFTIKPFETFTYEEAMARFGSDKPDTRFGLELQDVTELGKQTDFGVFKDAEHVVALFIPQVLSRKEIDTYTAHVKVYKAKGLAWTKCESGQLNGGISKFIESKSKEFAALCQGDGTLVFVADRKRTAQSAMGQLRYRLGRDLNLVKEDEFRFCWVKDFPLFAYNEDEGKWEPEHHMFSMPKEEFIEDFESRPAEVIGDLWDLVLNGWELASGSIRVSDPKIQERIMNFIGIEKVEAQEKFGFLLDAYQYGAPVHGGMGIGIDRLVALLLGLSDIREVIAFPKNKQAQCPMDASPSSISQEQLNDLHIGIKKEK